MEVILLQRVENLGNLGDRVNVRPGYGRNYLVPCGKAVSATEANIKVFEERRAELEKKAAEVLSAAEKRQKALEDLSVTITAKAADEGKLFGSVSNLDVANAISAAGVEIEKREVRMHDGAIHSIGEYDINIHLHTDVNATVKVLVEAE